VGYEEGKESSELVEKKCGGTFSPMVVPLVENNSFPQATHSIHLSPYNKHVELVK